MFGYLRPYKPELKMKEFAVYKAVYCGLCHSLGKRYGFFSRMILSYDATLLCLLCMSLSDKCCGFEKRRCPVKLHKKCDVARHNPAIDYWADISIILGYYKLKDNLHDSGTAKKAEYLLALPFASVSFKRASKNNPFAAHCADEYIKAQTVVEEKCCENIDESAHPTALLMSRLLSHNAAGTAQTRVLERMGLFLGRWIYLSDAAEDFADDIKSAGYNPFAVYIAKNSAAHQMEMKKLAEPLLNSCICEVTAALELLDIQRYNNIISNAFYLGMPEVKKAVLSGFSKKEKKKRFSAVYNI